MIKEYEKLFVTSSEDYKIAHQVNSQISKLTSLVSYYFETLNQPPFTSNHSLFNKTLTEYRGDDKKSTHKINLFHVNNSTISIYEESYFHILRNTYWKFEHGSLKIKISSEDELALNNLAKGIEEIIQSYENPPSCPSCEGKT